MACRSQPTQKAPQREPNERAVPFMRKATVIVFALLAVTGGLTAIVKLFDYDVWWHVRVGQWIWDHQTLPRSDPFSFTGDTPYGSHPVLSELVFHFVHAIGGTHGITALNAVLVAVIVAQVLVLALRNPSPSSAQLVACTSTLALWFPASSFRLGPKPELFTYIGLGLVLYVLRKVVEGPGFPALWFLPVLFVFWANLHRGGVMAIGFLVVTVAVLLARGSTRRKGWMVACVTFLSTLALCVNPSGIGYFTSTVSVMSTSSYSRFIREWAPMSLGFLQSEGKWFAVLGAICIVEAIRKRKLDLETVLIVLATVAAIKSVRLVPIAALTMVPACARLLEKMVEVVQTRVGSSIRQPIWVVLALAMGMAGLGAKYVTSLPPSAWGLGVLTWRVPVEAVDFLRRHPPPGERMWNNLNYGGYLLYALGPEKKVFIDGRNDMVYRPEFYEEALTAANDPLLLQRQLDRFAVDFAVGPSTGLIDQRYVGLFSSPDFVPVYMDDLVTVMVRKTEASSEYLREHAYWTLRPHEAVRRAASIASDPQNRLFEIEARRNVEQAPNSIRAWFVLALLEKARGRTERYENAREVAMALSVKRGIVLPHL